MESFDESQSTLAATKALRESPAEESLTVARAARKGCRALASTRNISLPWGATADLAGVHSVCRSLVRIDWKPPQFGDRLCGLRHPASATIDRPRMLCEWLWEGVRRRSKHLEQESVCRSSDFGMHWNEIVSSDGLVP